MLNTEPLICSNAANFLVDIGQESSGRATFGEFYWLFLETFSCIIFSFPPFPNSAILTYQVG